MEQNQKKTEKEIQVRRSRFVLNVTDKTFAASDHVGKLLEKAEQYSKKVDFAYEALRQRKFNQR